LLDDLKKALSERILNAELDEHLDDERTEGGANRRCQGRLTVQAARISRKAAMPAVAIWT
jgi:transposase-like protein